MAEITGAASATNSGGGERTAGSPAELSREEFMKILTSQLQNQNPMDPLKQNEFMGQLTSMQNLEVLNKLSNVVDQMRSFQKLSSAGNFIDKTVEGMTEDGQEVKGTVEKVSTEGSDVFLHVGSFKVPVDNVQSISS